jgi:hypothetical protein
MGMHVLRRFSDVAKGGKGIVPGAITLVIVLGAVAFFLIPSRSVLIVQTVNPEAAVFCAQITEREEWMISYTHSVNRRPVYDFLRVEGNGLRILRSRYDAFGAGMPETATPENPLRTGPDGWLEYTVNRRVPDLTIFVGRVAGHVLHVQGRSIPFTSLAEPGKALRFSAERRSLYQLWKGRCAW